MSDELGRVRRFRAGEPPASEAATASARRSLMAAISSAPVVPARRGRRVMVAVAGVCVVALIALALGTGSTSPTSAGAGVLQRLARVAGQLTPVSAPRHGQYLYVDSVQANASLAVGAGGQQCTALVPERRQIWIGADGAGRLLETSGRASFANAHDRATCERIHAVPVAGTSDAWFAPHCLELGLASGLARGSFEDPATLLREMRRLDGGPRTPAEDFVHVGDFLRESDDSPALRAAIFRAAATIPGVRLLGPTDDHLGRRGIGIGYAAHGYVNELIFDAHSSAFLGEQSVSGATGRATEWAAYRTSKIVNGVPSRPPGPLDPPCVRGGGYDHRAPNGVSIMTGAPLGH